jgi:hypothetical protein
MKLPGKVRITVLPEEKGFWIVVESREKYSFSAQYIAIGTRGNQISGDVSGFSGNNRGWVFVSTPFSLLKAGLVSITMVKSKRKVQVGKESPIQTPPFDLVPSPSYSPTHSAKLGPGGRIELRPSGQSKNRRVMTGSGYGGYAYGYAYAYGYEGAQRLPKRKMRKKNRRKKNRSKKRR